ncbi:MAG TPA: GNAT family N-acetyltransferase [Ideonella sp.]|nr:GNAT family N-acetyltransferase [Ideonella sp.]
MDANPARREIVTARLVLKAGAAALAPAVADYQRRNREHFAPWDPPSPESFYTTEAQAERIKQGLKAFADGSGYRWWLVLQEAPERVIGSVHFSQVSRGAFQSCTLGYALDAEAQGRGLMHEALAAGIKEMFSPRINLHRVQAAYQPDNARSAAVLQRLGFKAQGLAHDYLYIAGAWRDHLVMALTHPGFVKPTGW